MFGQLTKHASAVRVLTLDFFPLVAAFWRPGTEYGAAAIVRPSKATGFAYQADGAGGQTGLTEPIWPKTLGGSVTDGDVVWTAIDAGTNGVTAVSNPVVTVDPTGELTAGAPAVTDGKATDTAAQFTLSAGTLNRKYRVTCQVTAGSETLLGSVLILVVAK